MMTRSIVGRFLILAVLIVSLGVIAQAALIITRGGGKAVAKADTAPSAGRAPGFAAAPAMPVPAQAADAAPSAQQQAMQQTVQQVQQAQQAQPAQQPDAAPVRVVYPGPLGDASAQPRKFAASAAGMPQAVPSAVAQPALAQPVAAQPAAAQPVQLTAAAAPATPAPAAAAPPPAKPSPVVVASADADTQPAAAPAPGAGKGGVNLNSASVEALNHLGGGHIGQTIVKHRPYSSVEELVKKRVVRRSVYEQIKDQVAAQ